MCPRCGNDTRQVKAGLNNGRQQYQCAACKRRYTPGGNGRGLSNDVRQRAADLRDQGATTSQIAALLNITPRTVRNWSARASRGDDASSGSPDQPLVSQGNPALPTLPLPVEPTALVNHGPVDASLAPVRGSRYVTIRDVAERAKVAPSTISNYLNDKGGMSADTRRRIQDAIEALHFTPSALIRSIRSRRTRILGVVAFGLLNIDEGAAYSIAAPILAGINEGAEAAGHNILLYTSWHSMEPHGGLPFLDGHIDGLIVVGSTLPEPILARTAAAGLPITMLLGRHVPENVGYVNADNIGAMHQVVEHLVSLGRRRIGYYGPLSDSNYVDRYQGFSEAMAALGLKWEERAMQYMIQPGETWQVQLDKANAGLACLASMASELDAMVIPIWAMATNMVHTLRARSLRVPEDVAVVGFDDMPVPMQPEEGLTTIRQPLKQIGRTGVERLIALIDGAPVSECRITLPIELVVRASTVGIR
jgi:DNA-binding LacI/PurR family transcriptional regulator